MLDRKSLGASLAVWSTFQLVADGLYSAGRHIKELGLVQVSELWSRHCADCFIDSVSVKYAFTGLEALHLNLDSSEFLLRDATPITHLVNLMLCALPTLQHLTLNFGGLRDPSYPKIADHTLDNILYENKPSTGNDKKMPLVFPQLKSFTLNNLVIYGPALTQFLSAQPALQDVSFKLVFLSNLDTGWCTTVAEALPLCCKSWSVEHVGHGASNTYSTYYPKLWPFAHSGWVWVEPELEPDVKPDLQRARFERL
jgi:hypothetical protein